ncbi:MAG: hypothetical protein J6K17_13540 [Oscillospiraceae bacterium]|nr:hypothetical protein [Oscillospiraceae bacterium]
MNLKLSYRDKVIFIVVMVILVLVAGFFLLIKPKFEEVDAAKRTYETKLAEQTRVNEKIATFEGIVKEMKASAQEIEEKQKIFMDEGAPYVNENYIREAFNEINVQVKSMQTDYTTAGKIDRYIVNPKNILAYDAKIDADLYNELPQEVYDVYNKVKREEYPYAIIGVTRMVVTFDPGLDLQGAYDAIDRIAEDEKAIILNTIGSEVADVSGGDTEAEAEATITLYSVFPLNVEEVLKEADEIKAAK